MKLSRHHLAEVIAERTLGLPEDTLAKELAAFLLETRHTAQLEPLMRDVAYWRQQHGVVEATAVVAHELTPTVIDDIKQLLQAHLPATKQVQVDTQLDSSVIGGVRLELPREQLDMTVRAKLNKFKRLTLGGIN